MHLGSEYSPSCILASIGLYAISMLINLTQIPGTLDDLEIDRLHADTAFGAGNWFD